MEKQAPGIPVEFFIFTDQITGIEWETPVL